MNKWINTMAALCFSGAAIAQMAPTVFSGQLKTPANTPLHLKHLDGTDISIPVNEKGAFKVTLPAVTPGFYSAEAIGTVYLRPGLQLNAAIGKDGAYIFTGNGARENNLVKQLKAALPAFLPQAEEGFTQEVYMMEVPLFLQKLNAFEQYGRTAIAEIQDTFYRSVAIKNLYFFCNDLLNNYSLYYGTDLKKQEAFYKLMQSPEKKDSTFSAKLHKAYEDSRVKKLDSTQKKMLDQRLYNDWKADDAVLFRNSQYYRMAVSNNITHLMYTKYMKGMSADAGRERQMLLQRQIAMENIPDEWIKGYYNHSFTANALKMVQDSAKREKIYRDFLAGNSTPEQREDIKKIYNNAVAYSDNNAAPDFIYTSVKGEKVSLKSLRGKYVYIDVWATWCGPCKAEIPHLTKVEEDYHGRNISFVSLSVDQPGDKNKWVDYVNGHQLKGIQLMADKAFDSEFIQKFNINAIPRFILISPEGKIISADAKRPSDPQLRTQLNALL
ncbi:TlpA family protein disulfide reductase [Filimonas effusa]|uniref:TlpA family protein disulfide reductase n=1 Tax=Filimonas effusa TaxID=2508721 RepID=A0A4Q1D5T0_9BACT|nr:TlpA disulfide reductase family protein [Filimonas effusa]RXK83213.1 TlpA family protein disulfide reductase [Filimonas effusa]